MDDIRRQDLRLWAREFVDPMNLVAALVFIGIVWAVFYSNPLNLALGVFLVLFTLAMRALANSVEHRFATPRHKALWKGCQDRLKRFEDALKRMRRSQVADLREMPDTIRQVAENLYAALRRADFIAQEVAASERGVPEVQPVWSSPGDPQSQELYRIADRNRAEYRQQYAAVMAGVQRAEAQAAVFMTTVDTLRMRMIGYRLVGKSPGSGSYDMLESLAEARAQLESIDRALDELDLSHYPRHIAAIRPTEDPNNPTQDHRA